jgi:hypothetical protein
MMIAIVNVSLLSGDTSTAEQLGIKAISNTAKLSPKGAVGKRKRDGTPDLKTKRTPTKSTATPKSRPLGTQSRKSAQESPLKRVRVKKEAKTEASHFLSPQNSHKYLKQEPDPYSLAQSTPYIKEEPQHRNHDPGCIILSGLYRITCPAATSHFQSLNSSSMYLTLFRDADRGVWWASFTWSAWDMLIQMNPGPDYDTLGEGTSLGWRMRDLETGELKFGRGCTGEITFYRDQTLLGYLFEVPRVGTVEFWGQRIAGVDGVDGDEYQADWESFVKEAYGR